ncbi:unnamed protein product [Peronospora destructor]|uniref:Selenoprotein O n=1 Tax=Peronospora destructor TaxID=86335 RepID=A0AAV0UAK1_9STRA|nr:unnamed protein product [Peronospora destructor]
MARMVTTSRVGLSRSLSGWKRLPRSKFDNAVLRELPLDAEPRNFVRSSVPRACFSRVKPTPLLNPELVVISPTSLRLAGIELKDYVEKDKNRGMNTKDQDGRGEDDDFEPLDTLVPILAGNKLLPGSETAAQCYCGHQFGYFSGQLGDGAAVYLGEVVTEDERWELQLKGSGLTPYSRTADGRKVLRSTLREFLCSENMFALGVPTTRAGSVVVSRETQVLRDIFYNGNAKMEPTAVVTRIAKSFLRFGTFEIFKDKDCFTGLAGPSAHVEHKEEMMRQMLDFTIKQYFSEIRGGDKYEQFFEEVVRRTAKLVAKWQTVGFCHGVLNTDNMSIVGDTLDYGPFGFMEHFNPKHICNTSDDRGRYRYEAQPEICKWNCSVLADQLGLVVDRAGLDISLAAFDKYYEEEYLRLMCEKLGILSPHLAEDKMLVDTLLDVLAHTGADFTCTFRIFSRLDAFDFGESRNVVLNQLVALSETLGQRKRKLEQESVGVSDAQFDMIVMMLQDDPGRASQYGITPALVSQMKANREAKKILDATTEDERMNSIRVAWEDWIDVYISRIKEKEMLLAMAIDLAHAGDYDGVQHIFELLTHPFDEPSDESDLEFTRPQDPSTTPLCVSCSS